MVGAVLGALGVVGCRYPWAPIASIAASFFDQDRGDVEERRRDEAAELGLVRLEEQELGRLDRLEGARDARPARERARAWTVAS